MKRWLALCTLLALTLCGCSLSKMIEKLVPPDIQAKSRDCVTDLQTHDYAAIKAVLVPDLAKQDLTATFEKMSAFVPKGAPTSINALSANVNTKFGSGVTEYDISYACVYHDGSVIAEFVWLKSSNSLQLQSFRVYPVGGTEGGVSTKTGLLRLAILALAVFVAGLSVYALVLCARMKGLKRKWLWILFILVGLGGFQVNWATGAWAVGLLHFQLLSVGAMASIGGPWMVTVSVPVGAVVFLEKRRKLRKLQEAGPRPPDLPPPLPAG